MATAMTQVDVYRARLAAELESLNARALELERMRPQLDRSTYLTRVETIKDDREVLVACCHDAYRSHLRPSIICL
jgi:hypothetical protein